MPLSASQSALARQVGYTGTRDSPGARRRVGQSVRHAALAMILVIAAAACTAEDAASTRKQEQSTTALTTAQSPRYLSPFETQQLDWRPCGERRSCTYVEVPLSYTHLDGPRVRLAVSRVPASVAPSGVLLVNPGGPGASGADYAAFTVARFPRELLERYDVIGIDHRGTGRSRPTLKCLDELEMDAYVSVWPSSLATDASLLAARAAQLADGCELQSLNLLQNLSPDVIAKDTDVVRAALGIDRLSYLGKSYGTLQALVYASLYPAHVDRVVLDGVVDPTVPVPTALLAQASATQDALQQFIRDCARSACQLGSDPIQISNTIHSWWTGLPTAPASGLGRLSRLDASAGMAAALHDPEAGWPLLESALSQSLGGDHATISELARAMRGRDNSYWPAGYTASVVMPCLDGTHVPTIENFLTLVKSLETRSALFGPLIAQQELACLELASTRALAPVDLAQVHQPVLVVSTSHDPATPYAAAVSVRRRLRQASLVTLNGSGHTAFAARDNDCVDDRVTSFLLGKAGVEGRDVTCP